jgi:hypothetical protein
MHAWKPPLFESLAGGGWLLIPDGRGEIPAGFIDSQGVVGEPDVTAEIGVVKAI